MRRSEAAENRLDKIENEVIEPIKRDVFKFKILAGFITTIVTATACGVAWALPIIINLINNLAK